MGTSTHRLYSRDCVRTTVGFRSAIPKTSLLSIILSLRLLLLESFRENSSRPEENLKMS